MELYVLNSSEDKAEVMKSRNLGRAGRVAGMRAYRVLVGDPEGRRSLEKPRRRWENNIKIKNFKLELREVWWGVDWIDLAYKSGRWRAFVKFLD
jgi:hypothetical protein